MLYFKLHSLKWKICNLFKNWNKKWIEWNCICLKLNWNILNFLIIELKGGLDPPRAPWKEKKLEGDRFSENLHTYRLQKSVASTTWTISERLHVKRYSSFQFIFSCETNWIYFKKLIELIFSSFELRWIVLVLQIRCTIQDFEPKLF